MSRSSGLSLAVLAFLAPLAWGCGSAPEKKHGGPSTPPLKPCGAEVFTRGEGYNAGARECIWQAYRTREPAQFTTTRYTIEGDPITYRIEVTRRDVVVVVDSKDRYGLKGVFRHACRNLERIMVEGSEGRFGFALSGCTGGGAARLAVP